MKPRRLITPSKRFQKKLRLFLTKYPHLKSKLAKIFDQLAIDPFTPNLETHKLSGELKYFYACKIDYDNRLVFEISPEEITLLNIGTHDMVY